MLTSEEITDRLTSSLKALHMPTIRTSFAEVADVARRQGHSFERYLLELVEEECEVRRQRRVARLLQQSKLPLEKTMEAFDRSRLSEKVQAQVSSLLEGGFLKRTQNILAFGNPGSGKTHLLCGIGHELLQQGYRVLFRPCSLLVQELLMAKRELVLPKVLGRLARYEAIIIDDIGYVQQSREEMEVLFTLLAERYERGSVMLSSNLPFSKWEIIFKDPMTTAAAIDRLVHHAVILELNLPSYRLEVSKQRLEQERACAPAAPAPVHPHT